MQQISLATLYKQGLFNNISTLRVNTTGYPYVTLIKSGDKTKSTNLYFGRNSASLIQDNFNAGDSVLETLKDASVMLTENKQGEKRFKLSLQSAKSEYESASALDNVFGVQEKGVDFDFELFKSEFTTKEVTKIEESVN